MTFRATNMRTDWPTALNPCPIPEHHIRGKAPFWGVQGRVTQLCLKCVLERGYDFSAFLPDPAGAPCDSSPPPMSSSQHTPCPDCTTYDDGEGIVAFCPLHKAASELLEACKTALSYIQTEVDIEVKDHGVGEYPAKNTACWLHDILLKAIAKAQPPSHE